MGYEFRLCANTRDLIAHGHEKFLYVESKSGINEYYESIFRLLSVSNACLQADVELKLEKNIKNPTQDGSIMQMLRST